MDEERGHRAKLALAETFVSEESSPLTPTSSALAPGTLIQGTYRIVRHLGAGGMGLVVHAIDERLQRDVAIKFIHPDRVMSPQAREALLREARAMAKLRHPNLVEIHAFGEFAGRPYFVMEYVEGTNLEAWLADRKGHPGLDDAIGVMHQLCRGVSAMHGAGAVHRDLKPSNILIGPGFRVAITDLGLASLVGDERLPHPIVGTPAYIAPEVAAQRGTPKHLAHAVDIYALGVLGFEVLTGRPPFEANSTAELLRMHRFTDPPLPSQIRPELTTAFDQVLLDALAKDPEQRTRTAYTLGRELLAAREQLGRGLTSIRILLADDELPFLQRMSAFIRRIFTGATIDTAPDGATALRLALARPPDLAIIDLDMPELDGIELTTALRASSATKHIPIVVVTGVGGAPDWQLLRALGASGFLVKPFDPDSLTALIRRLIGSRDAAAARP